MGEDAKIREKRTGTPEWRNGHWHARVTLLDGTRPRYRFCLDKIDCTCAAMSEAAVADRCEVIAQRVRAKSDAEHLEIQKLERSKRLTVQQFGEAWTSEKLYETHGDVNGLRPKKSAKSDERRLKAYVYPEIGSKLVAHVTEQDIERTMQSAARKAKKKLGRPWRKAARFQIYQVMRRLFELAIQPGRLRTDNPVSTYLRPGHDAPKLFAYLYPSELLALLKCTEVPIARRVLYALGVYTGLRKDSLYALTWNSLNLQHGTLTSLKSKNGLPQLFEVQDSLVALLKRWHAYQGEPPKDAPLVPAVGGRKREAEVLRGDLETAGIDRPDLLGLAGENAEPLRFHDLRATFVTWAMREGRGDGWISDRTGHLTPQMRARYARAARLLADLNYLPFPSLLGAIPELSVRPRAKGQPRKNPARKTVPKTVPGGSG